jgi:hypothetical protein
MDEDEEEKEEEEAEVIGQSPTEICPLGSKASTGINKETSGRHVAELMGKRFTSGATTTRRTRHVPTMTTSSTALSRRARFQPLRSEVSPGRRRQRYGRHKSARVVNTLTLDTFRSSRRRL